MLAQTTTPPVWTSQTRSSPSMQPVDSTTACSSKLIKVSGARISMGVTQGLHVTIWMIGKVVSLTNGCLMEYPDEGSP